MANKTEGNAIIQEILDFIRTKVATLNWLQILTLLKQLVALLTGGQSAVQSKGEAAFGDNDGDCPFEECCQTHHDVSVAVADCWLHCCCNHPDAND